MTDKLDWIEDAAIENMKAQHTCADVLAKEAATTLTVFLAGMAGGMTYAAKALDSHHWNGLSGGSVAFTAWFFVLSGLLVWRCLMIRPIPSIYNEPRNLNQPGFTLEQLKEEELKGFQRRIDLAVKRNSQVAKWLNWLRLAAVASPIVFIVVAMAWPGGQDAASKAAMAVGCYGRGSGHGRPVADPGSSGRCLTLA